VDRLAESLEGLGGVLSFRDKWLSLHVACTLCALALALSLLLRGVVYPLWWVLDRRCPLRLWQGLTLVHFSAQPEPFLTQNVP